jgi:DNA-directed RNA polymerase specialized sigma24 family protein
MNPSWISRLSSEDGIAAFGSIFTDPDEDDLRMLSRVRVILDSLPPIEADFIDLYFFRHIKQTDIAEIFGVSQPTVCYRLQRAIQRIKYLLEVPQVDLEALRKDLDGFLQDPMDVDILVYMYETTCQSEAAKRLSVSQGLVRHRFIRSIDKMEKSPGMQFYADVFSLVAKNLNILREVRRPVPSARSDLVLDS